MIPLPSILLVMFVAALPAQNPGVLGVVLGFDGRDVVVRRVVEKGPAEAAGVRQGDRLMAVDEKLVRNPVDARARLYRIEPGSRARLTLARGDETLAIDVVLASWKTVHGKVKWTGDAPPAGAAAPGWWAERWDLPAGADGPPTPVTTKGKVVCLYLYQAL